MTAWLVVFDLQVVRQVSRWDKRALIELDAIQRVLRAEGPAGLDWGEFERAGFPDWEAVREAETREFVVVFEDRLYRLAIEIRPALTVVVRRISRRRSPFGL